MARQNEADIGKGLNRQSYFIASGIGEVDALLRDSDEAREIVVESHPEVCFRGLSGQKLQHSKVSAAGVGERLDALCTEVEGPGTLVQEITRDLVGESEGVEIDDVLDALALGVVAWRPRDEISFLPEDWPTDSKDLPMRFAYAGV